MTRRNDNRWSKVWLNRDNWVANAAQAKLK